MVGSKSGFETQLKKWEFKKRSKGEDWKALNYKIEKRKRQGKDTLLYHEGSLMPHKKRQKELSRQGYLSVTESLHWAQGEQFEIV